MSAASTLATMAIDRRTLDLAAPVLCTVGSLVALLAALFSQGKNRSALLSAVLGTVGSAAWTLAALDDAKNEEPAAASGDDGLLPPRTMA